VLHILIIFRRTHNSLDSVLRYGVQVLPKIRRSCLKDTDLTRGNTIHLGGRPLIASITEELWVVALSLYRAGHHRSLIAGIDDCCHLRASLGDFPIVEFLEEESGIE
jgi:hypothetical protein